jgi:hypothetical protein
MKNATIASIGRRTAKVDQRPLVRIELANGQVIIREEFQFGIDCANSNMLEDEAIRDCVGGTISGDFQHNEAGTSYIVDENSSLVKNGVINEATQKPYAVGDTAVRTSSGVRVEGFLTLTKNQDASLEDRIASQMAKQLLADRARRFSTPRANSTPIEEDGSGKEEMPSGEENPAVTAVPTEPASPAAPVEEIPAGEEHAIAPAAPATQG